MRDTDREAIENFQNAGRVLETIRSQLRADSGTPDPDSLLAVDDLVWPHHPTSQVSWLAMLSASDHLDLIANLADTASERAYITASFSVVRGALVGAAQALWILGSDDATTRQQRALSIGVEWLNQRIGYQTEQLKVCSDEQRERSQRQLDELLNPMLDDARRRVRKGHRYTDTKVIEHATRFRFTENVENAVVTADLVWRRLGGDAHALGWQLLLSDLDWPEGNDPETLGPVWVAPDLAGCFEAALWAATFLRVAMERFQLLAGPSSVSLV